MTRNLKELPRSILETEPLAQHPAYDMVDGKLRISFKPELPSARFQGVEFVVDEKPCVVIGRKKYAAQDIY